MTSAPQEELAMSRLQSIMHHMPLPRDWRLTETFILQQSVGSLAINLVGLIAKREGVSWDLTGSAASLMDYPIERAYYELLERIGIAIHQNVIQDSVGIEEGWCQSKSNGYALHQDKERATQAAVNELLERHAVLSSWYGGGQVLESSHRPRWADAIADIYHVMCRHFCDRLTEEYQIIVSGTFLIPKDPMAPLVYGFGAGIDTTLSLQKSDDEALQRMGFLWGEDIPKANPVPSASPLFHQETYLNPQNLGLIKGWLQNEYFGKLPAMSLNPPSHSLYVEVVNHVDLPPSLVLARARDPQCIPLGFGWNPPFLPKNFPNSHKIHPVP